VELSIERPDAVRRVSAWIAALSPARRLAAATALGAIAALALPPFGVLPVLLVAFPGLIALTGAARTRWGAFAAGWAFGMGHHVLGLYWVSAALFVDIARFWWALPLSVLGLPFLMSVYAGLATLLAWTLKPRGWARPLVYAGAWGALEWVRGHAFTGFPWNLAGYAWVEVEPVLQTASLFGIYALTLLTVLVASLPALFLDPAVSRRQAWSGIAAGLALLAAGAGWGTWRLAGDDGAVVPGVRLRLVQPAIPQALKWAPGQRDRHLIDQTEMSAVPSPGERPITHVIWAETAIPFFIERDDARRAVIAAAVPKGGLIIAGAPRVRADAQGGRAYGNGLVAIDERGTVTGAYDKAHLVPFGEYVPLRRFMPFGTIDANGSEYTPGPGPRTLDLPGLPPVSPLICYEVIFPGEVKDALRRPQWLLNITNDSWYGGSAGPYQHFAIARVRAVEEGLPLIRVANTGISGAIDAYGRVRARLGLEERGVVDTDLPVAIASPTSFDRVGNGPFLLFVLVCLAFCRMGREHGRIHLIFARFRRPRSRQDT
jgi:apolipoprotein N-acyltransferase